MPEPFRGTDVVYAGITLRNVRTLEFAQRPVRDPSDTDRWYNEFTIRVEATVNTSLMAAAVDYDKRLGVMNGGLSETMSAAQALKYLESSLGEDRKQFIYRVDGTDLLNVKPVDANNGPKVLQLNVVRVAPETIMVEFGVQVCLIMCQQQSAGSNESRPINNRWSCVDDLDENFRTTRTWKGLLRLSDSRIHPHAFRDLVVPPLSAGFRRKKMHFATPENWLELAYEITDEEMLGDAPPFPAVKMRGEHTETVQADVSNAVGECNISLEGPAGVDKRRLLELATQIVFNKLQLRKAGNYMVEHLILVDHIGEDANRVEARCRIKHTLDQFDESGGDASTIMGAIIAKIGKPIEVDPSLQYDPDRALVLGPYGTAAASIVTLFASVLQSPCDGPAYMGTAGGPSAPGTKDPPKRDKQQQTEAIVAAGLGEQLWKQVAAAPKLTQQHQQAIFTFYQVDSLIEEISGLMQLPVSAQANGGAGGGSFGGAIAGAGGGSFGGAIAGSSGAGSASTSAVVQLHQPMARRIVRISGERQNDFPLLFNKKSFITSNGISHVCLKRKVNVQAGRQGPNQTATYGLTAEYIYAMSRPLNDGEEMPVCSLPWDQLETLKTAIPGDSFKDPQGQRALG